MNHTYYVVSHISADNGDWVFEVRSTREEAEALRNHRCYEDSDASCVGVRVASAESVYTDEDGILRVTEQWLQGAEL